VAALDYISFLPGVVGRRSLAIKTARCLARFHKKASGHEALINFVAVGLPSVRCI